LLKMRENIGIRISDCAKVHNKWLICKHRPTVGFST
jgi:hypothetical protein